MTAVYSSVIVIKLGEQPNVYNMLMWHQFGSIYQNCANIHHRNTTQMVKQNQPNVQVNTTQAPTNKM